MHGGLVNKNLPARPNLDHLRGQAKSLLAQLKDGNAAAARAFIEHLPSARGLAPEAVRADKFRLADAQSVVARQNGFSSWPVLVRHIEQLRALEGEWRVARLEIDGAAVSLDVTGDSRILIDGDRFRTESAHATYEGIFTVDVEASPPHIDIEFVDGPEAGNWSYGIFKLDGDELMLCLGLVGSSRPEAFATSAGSGHALEHLRRASAARPADVTGGTPPPPASTPIVESEDAAAFDAALTPLMQRLQGEWTAVELVNDGKPLPENWLPMGSRTMTGNEVKVVFGGQTMVHAKVRIDDTAHPIAIDYLNLAAKHKGAVSRGIMECIGDDVRFLIAPPGAPRPRAFSDKPATGTLSRWRRRG
jgi:uncharacterized protein (TIGR03067 family)